MGYAILRVTAEQLRELHTIPAEVVFERTVASLQNDPTRDWCHDEHPFYFRIRHRYLPRTSDRGPLYIISLPALLKQMKEVAAQEAENRGKPVPENLQGQHWGDDDA